MKSVILLLAFLWLPPAAASATSGCASHWCMRLLGVDGEGYACMVGGQMGPNTCVATTSGCSRTPCRIAVLSGPGGRALAEFRPPCVTRQPTLSTVAGGPGIVPGLPVVVLGSPSTDRLQDLEEH